MGNEHSKFGVTCKELEDDLEIYGRGVDISAVKGGIYCYDDHRFAMSFSVLAIVAPSGTLIEE